MSPDLPIIFTTIIYSASFMYASFLFSKKKFSGSDAAGNAMAKGMTYFYGLGLFFIIAIVLTGINLFFFNNLTLTWVKYFMFLPVLIPLGTFLYSVLEIGRPRTASIEKQCHSLCFEIKTPTPLQNGVFGFRSSGGGSGSKITPQKADTEFTLYKTCNAIFYETGRKFQISSDEFETQQQLLDIPYQPEITDFTDWQTILAYKNDSEESIEFEFRYKVTK